MQTFGPRRLGTHRFVLPSRGPPAPLPRPPGLSSYPAHPAEPFRLPVLLTSFPSPPLPEKICSFLIPPALIQTQPTQPSGPVQDTQREFPISTPFLRKTIHAPPPRVNLQSPWPRLRVKRGSFGGSAHRSGLLPGSTLALLPTEGFPVLGSRMNTGNAYLLHPYHHHRVSNRKSALRMRRPRTLRRDSSAPSRDARSARETRDCCTEYGDLRGIPQRVPFQLVGSICCTNDCLSSSLERIRNS